MANPSLSVILSEAKNLISSFRVNSMKPCPEQSEGTLEIATPACRNACLNHTGSLAPIRHSSVQARRFAPRNDNFLLAFAITHHDSSFGRKTQSP